MAYKLWEVQENLWKENYKSKHAVGYVTFYGINMCNVLKY